MHSQLKLTLFGSPEVRLHSQQITGFRSSKAQALLYYLAATGWPHLRSALAGLLWADQPESAARASLSKCLSNLRDLLGEAVFVDRQMVAFNHEFPHELDTEAFAALAADPAPVNPRFAHLLALYRCDFLEGSLCAMRSRLNNGSSWSVHVTAK